MSFPVTTAAPSAQLALALVLLIACGGGARKSITPGTDVLSSADTAVSQPEAAIADEGADLTAVTADEATALDPGVAPPDASLPPVCAEGEPCDDGDPCTFGDRCDAAGACAGAGCDDGNECTIDACDAGVGCRHLPDVSPAACQPRIVVDQPARAASLDAAGDVTVAGRVEYAGTPTWGLKSLTLNGNALAWDPADRSFTTTVTPVHGVNPLVLDVEDEAGARDHSVRSFAWSKAWLPADGAVPEKALIADGVGLFLGPDVFDSDGAQVDLVTLIQLYFASLDLNALVQNPVSTFEKAGCTYDISAYDISVGWPYIDIVPVAGGLYLDVSAPYFYADIEAISPQMLCPDLTGSATADSIGITATLKVSVKADGTPVVKMTGTSVAIEGLDIHLEGVTGFLLNGLINLFEDDIAAQIADALKSELVPQVESAVAKALAMLAMARTFTVPALVAGGKAVTLTARTRLSSMDFSSQGAEVGMAASVTAKKVTDHPTKGVLRRTGCPGATAGTLVFPQYGQLEAGLHDDLINEVAYGLWWGGALRFAIDPAALGFDPATIGMESLQLTVDLLLPPMATSCGGDGSWRIQAGDVSVKADAILLGQAVQLQAYATAEVPASVQVLGDVATQQTVLTFSLDEPTFLDVEVSSVSGELAAARQAISDLVRQKVVPLVLASFAEKALVQFPIPSIDLSLVDPSIDGTIAIEPWYVSRVGGYWVASGDVAGDL